MYMQFESTRTENLMQIKRKMKGRDKEIELWLFKKGIPTRSMKDIKLQIREKVQQAVQEDTYNNLDNILPLFPSDVQRRIEESFAKLKQVPMLQGMDEGLLKIIHERLEPVRYTENMFIIQKGEILEKMFYIVDGFVSSEERSSDDLRRGAGELCGQELLRWRFYSYFPHRKPLATESVKAIGVVEALALNASDLQSIYDQLDILQKEKPRHKRMIKEEMERSIDGLIRRNGIPEESNQDVKSRIMKELFQEDKTVYWDILDWYHLVSCLPPNFENEMKSYMPLTKLKEMPEFRIKDDKVLKEICSHLRPKKYNRTDSIIEKGDPIQMLLIVKGRIGHQGREKGVGEIYGKEPLVSPFSTSFLDQVSTAAESPSVITDVVEALVLMTSDMERIATKFRKRFTKNYDIHMHNLRKRTFLRFFTEEEVKRATSNYTCLNYPNEGGYGTVYHTKLYGRAVAIKTCNIAVGDPFIQSQRLVHEAFVRSEIKHRNVESLFGCCLKTTWPIMVYLRFNALSLVEHFHRNNSKLSLESRMKIAAETAGALAYVHSKSIIHRDVKTANILIDQTTHTVIVSGFGASRLLHEDVGELEDEVPTLSGTLGYVDPEYLESHVLTKSDVYGFGVVLVELLTPQEAVSSDKPERSLANDFVCKVQEGRLGQILDGEINRDEFSFEIAKKVSELAMECLRSRAKERPSMKKVAAVLEGVVQTIIKPSTVGR